MINGVLSHGFVSHKCSPMLHGGGGGGGAHCSDAIMSIFRMVSDGGRLASFHVVVGISVQRNTNPSRQGYRVASCRSIQHFSFFSRPQDTLKTCADRHRARCRPPTPNKHDHDATIGCLVGRPSPVLLTRVQTNHASTDIDLRPR